MDITSALKNEIFDPLVTLVVPGVVATASYLAVLFYYFPASAVAWEHHTAESYTAYLVCVLAVGLLLEDVGSRIEVCWDSRRTNKDAEYANRWTSYQKLRTRKNGVAERIIHGVATRMRFELSMAPAVVLLGVGVAWCQSLFHIWSRCSFSVALTLTALLAAYLLWESYDSSGVLDQSRRLLIEQNAISK